MITRFVVDIEVEHDGSHSPEALIEGFKNLVESDTPDNPDDFGITYVTIKEVQVWLNENEISKTN